jgi:16S rRNA (adenine1518-N6/adenine1519-N6)-dimethyltransferase
MTKPAPTESDPPGPASLPIGPQGRTEIRRLLEHHGHHPNKSLGQHFLADPNLVDRIVRTAAVGAGDRVVEIGAGTGTLTAALAATGAHVVAYEIDRHLRPLLAESLAGPIAAGTVELRFEDATSVDLAAALPGEGWVLVANLPYNIGTPLLLDLLRGAPSIERFVVMVQREVAERLAADPGSRLYGLPSVVARLRGEVRLAFVVRPEVFVPAPDVDSAVVTVTRRPPPDGVAGAESLAATAFGQRRKMLRRSLAGAVADPEATLRLAGIDPTARPETLAPEDFVRLADAARRGAAP